MIKSILNIALLAATNINISGASSNYISNNQMISDADIMLINDGEDDFDPHADIYNYLDAIFDYITIYTSKGSPIKAAYAWNEFAPSAKEKYKLMALEDFPNLIYLSETTTKYNCHSYAWYNRSDDNEIWLNDPTKYITDGIYIESQGNVGDIVCYYNNDELIHSGVITSRTSSYINSIDDLANIQVISKWGFQPLFSHRGDYCTYMQLTTKIKYYTCSNHNKNLTYTMVDKSRHKVTCDNCTHYTMSSHNLYLSNDGYQKCKDCSYKSVFKFNI